MPATRQRSAGPQKRRRGAPATPRASTARRIARHPDSEPADGTRARILVAALEVFAERAGANLGLIQYYFDGKERLWKAAVTRAFEELQADFAAALPSPDDSDPL